ncbi:hypothetical protein KCP71_23615 [Salmonella enterica subsp. enterica]|nr:hypothetical protein KCP71_23615 [Salmonella enterica subsp. enterica]
MNNEPFTATARGAAKQSSCTTHQCKKRALAARFCLLSAIWKIRTCRRFGSYLMRCGAYRGLQLAPST